VKSTMPITSHTAILENQGLFKKSSHLSSSEGTF
jgi:hypothetical protein